MLGSILGMPAAWIRLLLLLLAVAWPSLAAARATPVATVEVVHYPDGSPCVDLHLKLPGHQRPEVLGGVCHGWSTFRCAGNVFVDVKPVVQADGVVLLSRESRTLDLTGAIDGAVKGRWPGYELLHLEFGPPSCRYGTLEVSFEGSRVPVTNGAGKGLKGSVSLRSSSTMRVIVEAAEPF